ncbi:hypothetical protein AO715_03410 [Xanthomonas sp. Mitacek01]|nr:hypothetical protein AO715_03410 [Xanthomonas sp. Mitacek01]
MELKDLGGLSKPLTRLIEVISAGVGAVARPYLVRRNADAKAYAVKSIANALGEVAEQHHLQVLVKDEGIEVWQRPDDRTLRLDPVSEEDRTQARAEYQERKRQSNVEQITSAAAAELAGDESVPDNAPDEDWVARFFSAAQDVSSDQMQELWGRILAGEIRRPGSFSLRTLDFVRNITKSDAELLEKMVNMAVTLGGMAMVPILDKAWMEKERQLVEADLFALSELGAMFPTTLALNNFMNGTPGSVLLISGRRILMVDMAAPAQEVQMEIWKFTQVGREVIELIAPDGDREHLEKIGRHYADHGASVRLAEIVERLPDGNYRFQSPIVIAKTDTAGGN